MISTTFVCENSLRQLTTEFSSSYPIQDGYLIQNGRNLSEYGMFLCAITIIESKISHICKIWI